VAMLDAKFNFRLNPETVPCTFHKIVPASSNAKLRSNPLDRFDILTREAGKRSPIAKHVVSGNMGIF
jgi:hypothetical protein